GCFGKILCSQFLSDVVLGMFEDVSKGSSRPKPSFSHSPSSSYLLKNPRDFTKVFFKLQGRLLSGIFVYK
ncbi:hypothetical protein HAX54_052942, partial [Datura stramonium]|nr:hypothetical protein [Datura stramonium]